MVSVCTCVAAAGRGSGAAVDADVVAVDVDAVDDVAEGGLEVVEGEGFPVLEEALALLLEVVAALGFGVVCLEALSGALELAFELAVFFG